MRTWDAAPDRPPFLIAAAPGSGKTRPALEFARELLLAGRINRVVVVCPTGPLTRQWAAAAAARGRPAAAGRRDAAAARRLPRHRGHVRAGRPGGPALGAAHVGPDTLVIADEAHHLGDELAWGEGFEAAFGPATDRWLLAVGHAVSLRSGARSRASATTDGVAEAGHLLHVRRRGPRRRLPAGHVHPLRRPAAVAQRRRRRRGVLRRRAHGARGGAPLPDGDQRRAARRPAADPRSRRTSGSSACAQTVTATRRASSSPRTASTRARSRRCCAR